MPMTLKESLDMIQRQPPVVQKALREVAKINLLKNKPQEIGSSDISCEAINAINDYVSYHEPEQNLLNYLLDKILNES